MNEIKNNKVIIDNQINIADHNNFEREATKVSLVSIFANIILTVFKAIAGVIANSNAMISDAVHSGSDVFSSIIVIIGVKISSKSSDDDHPYGHERFECVAAIILSVILCLTGVFIGYEALINVLHRDFLNSEIPGNLALIAAVVSIIGKEAMFWYTRFYAKKLDSGVLMADAWHHRSDSLSSIGALIGILGSQLGYPVFDPIASFVICIFIVKAAYEIFLDAINKMVDRSCDEETEASLEQCALAIEGVLGLDLLRTRIFGNKIYVDIEIIVEGRLTINEGHIIAELVHNKIEEDFPKVKHIMVHVHPN